MNEQLRDEKCRCGWSLKETLDFIFVPQLEPSYAKAEDPPRKKHCKRTALPFETKTEKSIVLYVLESVAKE